MGRSIQKYRNQLKELSKREERVAKYRREYEKHKHYIYDITDEMSINTWNRNQLDKQSFVYKNVEKRVRKQHKDKHNRLQMKKNNATNYLDFLERKLRLNEE
jgi:hypoxanthine phosphoribosyltransferase